MIMPSAKYHSISRSPNSSIAAVEEFWDEHVHDWKIAKSKPGTAEFFEEIEEYRYEKLDYLADAIDFERFSGKSILDVGVGVGNDLSRFARAGGIVTGVDLSKKSIELATANFRFRKLEGDFYKMNAESLQFPDNYFDAVFCHTVLHFTPNPDAMIREIHRVLKPGGEAILMTINRRSWMLFLHRVMKVELDYLDAPVYHTFSISEFRELLCDFTNTRVVPHRFPVPTKIHKGLKATVYNSVFVGLFNAMPRSIIEPAGHHLIAYAIK
jgi:2-polyprenyl-3-methyl-5-hydroxy-6-metoxy-1,4-benzoquinol methylase